MNDLLIKSVRIADPQSELNGTVTDILISGGVITDAGSKLKSGGKNTEVISAEGCYLSPGFVDLNANFGEPGLETKEDLGSGCAAAAAGGFTGVALMPNTKPPVHSKAEVAYLVNKAGSNLVNVYPLGCISHNCEGKELAEMYDMKLAGAIAFTDGKKPVANAGLMSRALLYTRSFDGLVFSYAEDPDIAGNAKMNEGVMSTFLGMKGNPSLAEELMVSRDLYLAEYNESRIHFSTISTAGAVDLIKRAKKAGVRVTCDVAAHALIMTEDLLEGFDSNYKVKPPLRTKADRKALLAAVKDGTIDAIVSQHTPHEIEFKDVEFEIASYGIIALQIVLPLLLEAGLSPELIAQKLSVDPRRVSGLPAAVIGVGNAADLVLYDPKAEWVLNEETNFSKAENSPFFGNKLTGKVKLVVNKGQFKIF